MSPAKILRGLTWAVVMIAFALFLVIAFSGLTSD